LDLQLEFKQEKLNNIIKISGSKSESNRLLILQHFFSELGIKNLSNSDDTEHLQKALSTKKEVVDIGHAGTAMRFLTAFFATQEGRQQIVLTGSERMQNRPIKILVDALKNLEAEISYVEKEGYPPLKIVGKKITKNHVQINGNVSSQYISALLLIAPSLKNGLKIKLTGKITSVPYINMTLSLLQQLGIQSNFKDNLITILPKKSIQKQTIIVESDWSSTSYFYSIIALSEIGTEITLSSYKKQSLQGDACLSEIYKDFGVETLFKDNTITLKKVENHQKKHLTYNLKNAPDIAQTIAVTSFGLGISCDLLGLHTLKIKETDRLEALKKELTKLGANINITNDSLSLKASEEINKNIAINTYNDHRMAMAFAPLAIKTSITILEAEVVTKSYQNFWKDLQQIGFQLSEL